MSLILAAAEGGTSQLVTNLSILVLAGFVGYAVISKVPNTLHTPLMSGSNAISGITLVGALISSTVMPGHETLTAILATGAVFLATINVVGGYVVTDRMLAMFKKKGK